MKIELSEEQEAASDAAVNVIQTGFGDLSIGGYAGTGKTTVIRDIIERCGDGVAVCAFSGKAVSVLRKKGIERASTIHSLMYELVLPVTDPPEFFRRSSLDCTAIVVDEASMVNSQLAFDLSSYGKPIIWVGDHGQLQPIGEDPGLMLDPHIRLEKIHRQSADSPILNFAHAVRVGDLPVPPKTGDLRSIDYGQAWDTCSQFDMVLCATNKTRRLINSEVRRKKKFKARIEVGERLICLRNNPTSGIYNGQILTVVEILADSSTRKGWQLKVTTDADILVVIPATLCEKDEHAKWTDPRYEAAVDYGYAMTVHKAQGSEADNVLVIEDYLHPEWNHQRWRYTAATRAAKKLAWCKPPR